MSSDQENGQSVHRRADHEDVLNLSRTGMFISLNGFLAVAVGLVGDRTVKIGFVCLVLLVDGAWVLWAPNARRFIRTLRDAGKDRIDEQLWNRTVGKRERKYRWITDPLTIMSFYVPGVFTVGWIMMLLYLIFGHRATQSYGGGP